MTFPVLYRIMDELDDLLLPYTIDLSIYANIDDPDQQRWEATVLTKMVSGDCFLPSRHF